MYRTSNVKEKLCLHRLSYTWCILVITTWCRWHALISQCLMNTDRRAGSETIRWGLNSISYPGNWMLFAPHFFILFLGAKNYGVILLHMPLTHVTTGWMTGLSCDVQGMTLWQKELLSFSINGFRIRLPSIDLILLPAIQMVPSL